MTRMALVAVVVLTIVAYVCPSARPYGFARDFPAFYCSGAVVLQRADPYRAEPLGACERAPKKFGLYSVPQGLTLPAPLPPYDLLGFAVLAKLPYEVATGIWFVLILAALVATVEAMHRITGLSRSLLYLVFAPIDGCSAIFLGEVAPMAVASLAISMRELQAGRPRVAAAALAVSLCEPHVGIAPMLALFVCVPKTRVTLAVTSMSLVVISFATVGVRRSFEYVRDVLPAHAVSEITSTRQLSLTAFLHSLGFSDGTSLTFGSLSYLAMLAVGVFVARRLASRDPDDPLIVAAPAAFVLLGGVFIHTIQMPAAFPAAIVAYARASGRLRTAIGIGLVVLAIPWLGFLPYAIVVPAVGFLAYLLVSKLLPGSVRIAIVAAFVTALYVYGLELGIVLGDPFPGTSGLFVGSPTDLAEVSWGANIRALANYDRIIYDFARIPAWLSIATIAVALGVLSRSRELAGTTDRAAVRLAVSSHNS